MMLTQGMEPSTAEECELTSSLSASSLHEELCAFIQEVEKVTHGTIDHAIDPQRVTVNWWQAQRDDASFSTEAALTSMAGGNKENVAAVLSTMEQNAHSMMAQGIMEPALGSQLLGWVRPINQIIFLPFLPAVGADTHYIRPPPPPRRARRACVPRCASARTRPVRALTAWAASSRPHGLGIKILQHIPYLCRQLAIKEEGLAHTGD